MNLNLIILLTEKGADEDEDPVMKNDYFKLFLYYIENV